MNGFYKLKIKQKNEDTIDYIMTGKNDYSDFNTFPQEVINKVLSFAYGMSFGKEGQHRDHRTGGIHQRRNGEIFVNAFQGKLAEYALYLELKDKHTMQEPDLEMYDLGEWDNYDFMIDGKVVSVKSTKNFGRLLLLETEDWDENGVYTPNNQFYDYIFMVRIKSRVEEEFAKNKLLYTDECDFEKISKIIHSINYSYDVPRYISNKELINLIKDNYVIHQNDTLNGTKIDADNIYCYIDDMHKIKK